MIFQKYAYPVVKSNHRVLMGAEFLHSNTCHDTDEANRAEVTT
jgi:hypothetical protein